MDVKKRKSQKWICIAIALMLISMIGASLVQTSGGKVKVKDLRWETSLGLEMSGLLFVPEGVSAESKAPAIIVSHGMLNNREMQDLNYVELARRGYVVLSMDMFSHGNSESLTGFAQLPLGMYEAVKMLSSINYVDTARIGITGHSFGGLSCNTAVALDNQNSTHLIAAVLVNSCDATYTDTKTKEYINVYGNRDVGIIAGQYDEFMFRVVDENGNQNSPRDFVKLSNAQSFLYYGTDPGGKETRAAETLYHETIDGQDSIRVIYNPPISHPWSHFSARSTTATIDFFNTALGAPNPISASDQVWQWKVFFNVLGLIGFAVFAVNFAILMVFTPFFSSLRAPEPVTPRKLIKGGRLWMFGTLAGAAIFGTLIYLPLLKAAPGFTPAKHIFPQSATWGLSLWAVVSGLFAVICVILVYRFIGKKNNFSLSELGVSIGWNKLGKSALLGLVVAAVTYAWVFFADYFFKVDFRIWVLSAKTFEADKVVLAIFPYAVFFMIYFIAVSIANNTFNYNTLGNKNGKGAWINTTILAVFNVLPAVIICFLQYVYLFSTGVDLFSAGQAHLYIVWLFPMIVIIPASAVISRKIYRVTNNPYLPGIINGLIVTMMCCANTLTWR